MKSTRFMQQWRRQCLIGLQCYIFFLKTALEAQKIRLPVRYWWSYWYIFSPAMWVIWSNGINERSSYCMCHHKHEGTSSFMPQAMVVWLFWHTCWRFTSLSCLYQHSEHRSTTHPPTHCLNGQASCARACTASNMMCYCCRCTLLSTINKEEWSPD